MGAPGQYPTHIRDQPVWADTHKLIVGGHSVYGAWFEPGMGYRNDMTSGVATGDDPETMYMVTSGVHYNGGCCFDYGNAETDDRDDGAGTMETIYFGSSSQWGHGEGAGPWVMADLENNVFPGDELYNANAVSMPYPFVTALVKGRPQDGVAPAFALKGGNAQDGELRTNHEGNRPRGYEVMRKQGAIVLGVGGDDYHTAQGTFYEGAVIAGYSSDTTDDAVHANIIAAGYAPAAPPPPTPTPPTGNYEQIGSDEFCINTPRYIDGPHGT